jgi:hypothetical protein
MVRPPAEEPVFLDTSGRRRRLVITVGLAFAGAILSGIGMLAFGLGAGTPVTVPGWPGADLGRPEPVRGEVGPARLGAGSPTPTALPRPDTSPGLAGTATTRPASPPARATPAPTPMSTPNRGAGTGNRPTAKPSKSPGKPG